MCIQFSKFKSLTKGMTIMFKYILMLTLCLSMIAGCSPEKNLETKIEAKVETLKVIYFGAVWCGPCQRMKAEVLNDSEVKKELDKIEFKMYDIDKSPDVKKKYGIAVVPTTLVVKGKSVKRYEGYLSKVQFLKILSQ